jgi:predicted GIY-YIG superfamily endonuclease
VTESTEALRHTALYRYFSHDGSLLYIGITHDLDARDRAHAHRAGDTWYPLAAQRTVDWFDTRDKAEAAEAAAIKNETPAWNFRHMATGRITDDRRDRPRIGRDPAARKERATQLERGERSAREARRAGLSLPEWVTKKVRQAIRTGEYAVAAKIPSAAQLGRQFGVSHNTIVKGLAPLKAEGLLITRPYQGTFVVRRR